MTAQISEHITAEYLSSGTVILKKKYIYYKNQHEKGVSIVLSKDEVSKLRIALEAFERKAGE